MIIAMLGLLFFGKRLPEVGRSLGKGIVEFKKGLKGVEDEVMQSDSSSTTVSVQPAQPQLPQQPPAGYIPAQNTTPYAQPQNAPYGQAQNTPYVQPQNTPYVAAQPGPESVAPASGFRFDPHTGKPLTPDAVAEVAGEQDSGMPHPSQS
jgi:sec-independent protein translocase protein TatA